MNRSLPTLLWGLLSLMAPLPAAADDSPVTDDGWEQGDDSWDDAGWDQTDSETGPVLHGFSELALGGRTSDDPALADESLTLGEFRNRFELESAINDMRLSIKADLYVDAVEHGGHGRLREAKLDLSPAESTDLRLGRQVLTWGTGDLLFLNDLFPKDWVSFFSGRDDEYLKAPSDSLKLSHFTDRVNFDLVWTPEFEADRSISGQRFSYFNSQSGLQTAQSPRIVGQDKGEWAVRIFGTEGSTEWALYGYYGFWKQANAMTVSGSAFHSPLQVYGASLRDNLFGGLGNIEIAWYETADGQGTDPAIPNDQFRWLSGYEREIRPRLTLGVQYYLEWTQQYDALKSGDAGNPFRVDEYRHLISLRLTQRLLQDNLQLSWFSFWSPSDRDWLLRPVADYRFNDQFTLTAGANIFGGKERHTFFGQFEDASNLYLRLRYSF